MQINEQQVIVDRAKVLFRVVMTKGNFTRSFDSSVSSFMKITTCL